MKRTFLYRSLLALLACFSISNVACAMEEREGGEGSLAPKRVSKLIKSVEILPMAEESVEVFFQFLTQGVSERNPRVQRESLEMELTLPYNNIKFKPVEVSPTSYLRESQTFNLDTPIDPQQLIQDTNGRLTLTCKYKSLHKRSSDQSPTESMSTYTSTSHIFLPGVRSPDTSAPVSYLDDERNPLILLTTEAALTTYLSRTNGTLQLELKEFFNQNDDKFHTDFGYFLG